VGGIDPADVDEWQARYKAIDGVLSAEPDQTMTLQAN
jgi:hypothetical protein